MFMPIFNPLSALATLVLGRRASGNQYPEVLTSGICTDPGLPQISTITAGGAGNEATYSVKVVCTRFGISETVSVTTDASGTAAELATLIYDALRGNGLIGAVATITKPTATTVRLTGARPGADYAFAVTFPTNPSTHLSVATGQPASDWADFYFGRAVAQGSGAQADQLYLGAPEELTGPVLTLAVTHGTTPTFAGTILATAPTGVQTVAPWTATGGVDLAADLAAIDAAITAVLPAYFSVATSSPNIVITAPPGWTLLSVDLAATGSGAAISAAYTAGDAVPNYFVIRDPLNQNYARGETDGTIRVLPGQTIPVIKSGGNVYGVPTPASGTVTDGAPVYVETAAGSDNGKLLVTPTLTSALLKGTSWRYTDTVDTTLSAWQAPA